MRRGVPATAVVIGLPRTNRPAQADGLKPNGATCSMSLLPAPLGQWRLRCPGGGVQQHGTDCAI
eukprot:10831568-Alexandrium_andersonii.AAC.1